MLHRIDTIIFTFQNKFMPNTYTQIHIQLVFAVKYRSALIEDTWKDRLCQYTTGIIQNKSHKMLHINTMPDHLHMLIGLRPDESLSQLVQVVKTESTNFINENYFTHQKFAWQEGFGAFSYSRSSLPDVIRYIQNQEEHHRKRTFREEYLGFLKAFDVEFDERYIFRELVE